MGSSTLVEDGQALFDAETLWADEERRIAVESRLMGLLDWFRRRSLATPGGEDTPPAHRAHREDLEAGSTPAEPPAGVGEAGSITGDDAEGTPGERP